MRNAVALVALAVMCLILACNKVHSQEAPTPQVNAEQPVDVVDAGTPEETGHVVTYANEYAKTYEGFKRDWIEEVPELPNYEGWYRHLGADLYYSGLFSFASYVGVYSMEDMLVFDRVGGQKIWEFKSSTLFPKGQIVGGSGWICFADYTATAVNMIDGNILWKKDDFQPLAAFGESDEAAVWLARKNHQGSSATEFDEIQLVSAFSGETLQTIVNPNILAACVNSNGNSDVLAIRTTQGFKVFDTNSEITGFDAPSEGGRAELLLVDDVLISLESIPIPPDVQGFDSQQWFENPTNDLRAILTAYELDGKVLWRNEIDRSLSLGFETVMSGNGKLIVLNDYPGLIAYSFISGELLFQTPKNNQSGGHSIQAFGKHVLWDGNGPPGMNSNLALLDPADGENRYVLNDPKLSVWSALAVDNQLLILATTDPSGHGFIDSNHHLLAFALGTDNLPKPGELVKWGVPASQSGITDRFFAARNPIADDTLLEEVKAGGINTFSALLDRIDGADVVYLDALGHIAAELKNAEPSPGPYTLPTFSQADALLDKLHAEPNEEYSDTVLDWLNDPAMEVMHYPMLGVLAACGGTKAGSYLDSYYEGRKVIEREVLRPPFNLTELSKVGGVPFQVDQMPGVGWAEVVTDSGERIVAFVSDGLVSSRDIYIGVDTDNDGSFEEILPTGLNDTYFHHVHPGGIMLRGKPENIELVVDGENLQITYHEPVMEEVVYDSGGESHTYMDMNGGEFVTATLSFAELRLDSDGDGLSDITEQLLFTNPDDPDTDGDGIRDDVDPCPNVDPATMGKLERGIARALDYYFRSGRQSPFWEGWNEGQPWVARYIAVEGAGPVAYSQGDPCFGICLSSPKQTEKYQQLLNHYNAFSLVEVSLMDTEQQWVDTTNEVSQPELSPEELEEMEQYWQQMNPGGHRYFVYINLSLHGASIPLAEIDGELYPVKADLTWIS